MACLFFMAWSLRAPHLITEGVEAKLEAGNDVDLNKTRSSEPRRVHSEVLFNMRDVKVLLILTFLLLVASLGAARIFCRDECEDFEIEPICASNGINSRFFSSHCHLIQHNQCFTASKKS
jgi:Kazal-type serine protease inhibitor domain